LASHCDMTSAEGRAKLVAEAKPLLGRLQTPLLRLQLVKRLADASGFSQPEVERLCDLRPIVRAAPARAPRQAPSLLRPLLRLLLQKPQLAKGLPLDALPSNSAEARAARNLCEVILSAGDPPPAYAVLLERLRGNEDEGILREAAAELMQQPFEEDDIDVEFEGAVKRLVEGENKRAFDLLQEKVHKLGVAGLSGEEKQQYLQALSARGRTG
jgi:DNA primase